jgi:hypothetical protein
MERACHPSDGPCYSPMVCNCRTICFSFEVCCGRSSFGSKMSYVRGTPTSGVDNVPKLRIVFFYSFHKFVRYIFYLYSNLVDYLGSDGGGVSSAVFVVVVPFCI